MLLLSISFIFFFFNDTATTEIYTLSLHDALPICDRLAHPAPLLHQLVHRPQLAGRIGRVPRFEVLEPSAVRVFGERLQPVRHPDQIVASPERIARRVTRAAVGVQTRDAQPRDPALGEAAPESRIEKGAVRLLADDEDRKSVV